MVDTTSKISQEFDNLAMAATADCNVAEEINGVIRQLTESNKQLTDSNNTLTTQIKPLTETNAQLINQLGNHNGQQGGGHHEGDKRISAYGRKLNPEGYCCYHWYKMAKGHTGKSCSDQKIGHQDDTTRANPVDSSEMNKEWVSRILGCDPVGGTNDIEILSYVNNLSRAQSRTPTDISGTDASGTRLKFRKLPSAAR